MEGETPPLLIILMVEDFDSIFAVLDMLPVENSDEIPVSGGPVNAAQNDGVDYDEILASIIRVVPVISPEVVVREQPVPVVKVADPERRLSREEVLAMAQSIYGEDRVDMQSTNSSNYILYIYFPEFTITDGKHKHVIRGLYTRFTIREGASSKGLGACYLHGLRSILTPEEVAYLYGHSHLESAAAKGAWSEFCQGASQFKALIIKLIAGATEEAWTIVLLGLSRYLEWESLEGGPYKHISQISARNQQRQGVDFRQLLGRMSGHIPEIFEFTTSLEIPVRSPKMEAFYQEHSPVRTLNSGGSVDVVQALRDWNSNYRMEAFKFKGATVTMTIVNSVVAANSTLVDRDIIERFNNVLITTLQTFNNNFDYEYARYSNGTKLGKIPTFQPADIAHYKKIARNRRALSRARRKQGVVGGVNHLRKREDNRFGQLGDNS